MGTRQRILHAVAAAVVTALITAVAPLDLLIHPEHGHLAMSGDNMTVVCNAFEPIAACQFSFIKDELDWEGPLLDLSQGANSRADPDVLNESILGYKYFGGGLDDGMCGVTLHLKGWKRYIAGCRTRTATGGWRYATMSFTADQSRSLEVKVTPKVKVALPGSDVNVLCSAVGPLTWCRFDLPSPMPTRHIFLDQGPASRDSTPEHRYYGAGLAAGECGVTLNSVSEQNNGFAWCGMVANGTPTWERTAIPVVVARAPNKPKLEVKSSPLFEGSELKAICTVTGGRPAPNITWYLGAQILREDSVNDVADTKWAWPTSIQTITQTLKHRLVAADSGRELRCEASHVALPRPLVDAQVLTLASNICPPLTSKTVLITCIFGGDIVDCGKPVPIGTVAKLECKPEFKKPDHIIHIKTVCRIGGKWSNEVFKCTPDCGRRKTNSGVKLVAGGHKALVGEFPWQVAIYKTLSGELGQVCGGTLITTNIVISAAHCFWDNIVGRKEAPSGFKVAAGKHLRAWEDSNPRVQIRDVEDIILRTLYRGRLTNYAADIAIVRASTAFEITTTVNLACIDWDNIKERWQLVAGNTGVVAGWGYTQDGVLSDSLQYVELPYVPPDQCLDSLSRDLKSLLTGDKFCAGFINQTTSVCPGDSGGGLMFHHSGTDKYYLRGIVSLAFAQGNIDSTCYSQHYTAFTHFSQFIPWIQDNIDV